MRPARSGLTGGGGVRIDDVPSGTPDDGTVVPFGRSTGEGSRLRHPAGGGVPDEADLGDGDRTAEGLPTERSIARGLVAGRRWALAAAFERWADLVHGVARQLVGRHAADDVTQQVFIEAWRSRNSFSPDRGEVPGWLVGITRNVARGHLRRRGPLPLDVDERRDGDERARGAEDVVDGLLVAEAFRSLPPHQRAVLELTLIEEYTQSEAAARLEIPLGTAKTRHRRGLAALRAALDGVRP